jgi:hypothetical protein
MRVEYKTDKVSDMSYPLFLYELRYVPSPVVPGLTQSDFELAIYFFHSCHAKWGTR